MTTDISKQDRDATASAVYCIETNKNIDRLVHDMLHSCKTVEEYTEKLSGLLKIFWGKTTPEKKNLDDVNWLEVMVQIIPTKCLISIFKQSILKLEGKENDNEETENPCGR